MPNDYRKQNRGKEPKGELFRYAFGYSDKKPGLAFWLILAGMIVLILYDLVTITLHG